MKKKICLTFLLTGLLMVCLSGFAQDRLISGIITGDDSAPLPGVTVTVKETNKSVQTNAEGKFSISASTGQTLRLSYVGYTPKDVVIDASSAVAVTMEKADKLLDDVVVVGYGTQRKVNLTGAVTSVDVTKTFGSKPLNDPARALQGIVPGLTIQYGNGGLTAGPSINIRGVGSVNGSSRPLILVDNVETPDLSIINPNDIESISVLKDVASTSIYGARAAFGVVLVKTKTGKKNQKMTVTYNNYFSANKPTSLPEFADPVDELTGLQLAGERALLPIETFGMSLPKLKAGIINWKQKYEGKNGLEMVKGEDWDIDPVDGRAYFFKVWDPKKEMLNDYTLSQQHNISIQGGGDKVGYFVSGSYSHDGGLFKMNPDQVDKYNITAGLNLSPTKWLDISVKTLNRNFSYDYPYGYQDYWYYFWRWGAYFPFGTYQGDYFRTNSAYLAQASKSNVTSNYQRLDLGATIKINKDLSIRADYTIGRDNTLRHETSGPIMAWDYWAAGPLNLVDIASSTNATTYTSGRLSVNTFNAYATYQKTIASSHNLKLTGGINAEKDEAVNFNASRKGLLDPSQGELGLTYGDQGSAGVGSGITGFPTSGHGQRAFAGYWGRFNYDYEGKYLLEVNGRYDGSSSFPIQDRWAFFPSASVGYRVSEENFFQSLKSVVSELKFRASYGELGNQDVGGYYFLPNMGSANVSWLTPTGTALTPTIVQPQAVAQSLKWERVGMLDLGADMRILNNHVGVTFDWYERNTKGMIQPSSLPSSFGTTAPRINAGNFRTRGYEISVDANYNIGKNLQLYGTLNFWDSKTVFTKWDNPNHSISNSLNYEGKTLGEIWGFESNGYFQSAAEVASAPLQKALQSGNFVFGPGDMRYADLNGDKVINAGKMTLEDHGDVKKIGNTQPRYQYSARIGGIWKSFDLDIFLQGVGKRDWWGVGNIATPMYQSLDILYDHQLDYWTPENTDAKYPRLYPNNNGAPVAGLTTGSNNFVPQTGYLLNLAYMRLKNVTIGYTLPVSLMRKYTISKLRVFLTGENLAEISHVGVPIDPEITDASSTGGFTGRNWPFMRSYAFGIQLTF